MNYSTTTAPRSVPSMRARPPGRSAGDIGLWVFIGVACSLFSLFIAAYLMRMAGSDWFQIAIRPLRERSYWISQRKNIPMP